MASKRADWLNALGAALSSGVNQVNEAQMRRMRQMLADAEMKLRERSLELQERQATSQEEFNRRRLDIMEKRPGGAVAKEGPGEMTLDDMVRSAIVSGLGRGGSEDTSIEQAIADEAETLRTENPNITPDELAAQLGAKFLSAGNKGLTTDPLLGEKEKQQVRARLEAYIGPLVETMRQGFTQQFEKESAEQKQRESEAAARPQGRRTIWGDIGNVAPRAAGAVLPGAARGMEATWRYLGLPVPEGMEAEGPRIGSRGTSRDIRSIYPSGLPPLPANRQFRPMGGEDWYANPTVSDEMLIALGLEPRPPGVELGRPPAARQSDYGDVRAMEAAGFGPGGEPLRLPGPGAPAQSPGLRQSFLSPGSPFAGPRDLQYSRGQAPMPSPRPGMPPSPGGPNFLEELRQILLGDQGAPDLVPEYFQPRSMQPWTERRLTPAQMAAQLGGM